MAVGALVAALLVVVMVIVILPLIAPETIATFIAPPAWEALANEVGDAIAPDQLSTRLAVHRST
jgi:hypothetical protein